LTVITHASASTRVVAKKMNPNQEHIKAAFESPQWYLSKNTYNIRIRADTVKHFASRVAAQTILDIGCGDGSLSLHLLRPENSLTLLDRSKAMLEIAAARVPAPLSQNVRVINDDFEAVNLRDQAFDLVLCVGVLAYVADLASFLRRLATVVSPGGSVIVECTDATHCVRRAINVYSRAKGALGHADMFTTVPRSSADVLDGFARFGFRLAGSFRYSQPFPVVRRLMPQRVRYGLVRSIFGTASSSRWQAGGSECLFHFSKVSLPQTQMPRHLAGVQNQ